MKRGIAALLTAIALLACGWSVAAHHSFAAQYDRDKPITLKGGIARIEWANPHIYFYIDVKETAGTVNYAVEGGTPNQLRRQGWGKDSLKIGDTVTVQGFLARKAGVHTVNGRTVTLQDGRRVFGFSGAAEPGAN